MRWQSWMGLWCLICMMGAGTMCAEEAVVTPDRSVGAALRSMALRADAVFVGQVVAITRKGGVVEVAFRVDSAVSGSPGGTFTLREWAGLWPPGMLRYALGQRALVYVHAASAAGLSTPVNGAEGVVPVIPGSGSATMLDVSRLATRVQRSGGQALLRESEGAVSLADAVALVRTCRQPRWTEPLPLPLPIALQPIARPIAHRTLGSGDIVDPLETQGPAGRFLEAGDAQ